MKIKHQHFYKSGFGSNWQEIKEDTYFTEAEENLAEQFKKMLEDIGARKHESKDRTEYAQEVGQSELFVTSFLR